MALHRVLFIGAGRMAQAMIQGISEEPGNIDWQIFISNQKDRAKREFVASRYRVESVDDWANIISTVDVIILAMPPRAHPEVLSTLAGLVSKEQVVMSVAAGIGVSGLQSSLGNDAAVAWCMPNVAAAIKQSMTLVALSESVTSEQRSLVFDILRGLGEFHVCSEAEIHDLTSITGSAPAYVFQMAHVLETLAVSYGIEEGQARKLVGQMILGSGRLLMTGEDPLALSDAVTTPGGSTEAGHAVLQTRQWHDALRAALVAVNQHAKNERNPSSRSPENE